eukprot:scaffold95727_cov61-Attheya_sp.AAC.1
MSPIGFLSNKPKSGECFHEETNAFQGVLDLKKKIYVYAMHHHHNVLVWSHEEVVAEMVAHLRLLAEKIKEGVDIAVAKSHLEYLL